MPPDGDITCTFTNEKLGTIQIKKTTTNLFGDTFEFATNIPDNAQIFLDTDVAGFMADTGMITVAAGEYLIEEVNLPNGWAVSLIECTDKNTGQPSKFTIDPNDTKKETVT